jgi:hypothetical protein
MIQDLQPNLAPINNPHDECLLHPVAHTKKAFFVLAKMASHVLIVSASLLVSLLLCCVLSKGDMTVIPLKNGADHRGRSLQSTKVFNVLKYGARGDGRRDDTMVCIMQTTSKYRP